MSCLFCNERGTRNLTTNEGILILCQKHYEEMYLGRLILAHDDKSITIWKGNVYIYFTENNVKDCHIRYVYEEFAKRDIFLSKDDKQDIADYLFNYKTILL